MRIGLGPPVRKEKWCIFKAGIPAMRSVASGTNRRQNQRFGPDPKPGKKAPMTFKARLLAPERRERVVKDAVALVESEVKAKGGISGMAIKAGFAAVNKVKPTLIPEAVNNLLERFLDQLEPFLQQWTESGRKETLSTYLSARQSEVANALLAVTDQRAQEVKAGLVKKTYQRLRPTGQKNVEAAIPGLGRTLQPHLVD